MIELFSKDLRFENKPSSKGNQFKWENSGFWYKADYTGYEGLSEYMISHLLRQSDLSEKEFVTYEPERIKYKSSIFNGAKSPNFLHDDWQIITLERLFENSYGESLNKAIYTIKDEKERLRFLVQQTIRITGLTDFGVYMNKLLTIDAFFLNEDRHTHNIAVLMNGQNKFLLCPIFDNGAGLLSDITLDYPVNGDIYTQIESVKPKTFSQSFDIQLDISEELFGRNLKFSFTKKDVTLLLNNADIYSDEIRSRVEKIIFEQMRKYKYLF